ncbi:VIN3-like protein 2 isoform X1 [Typha latifolia]|uniref:VIN3-like protein 2 isoform X1 n=1 Tax=Typha latifolia TaxID=4733 RepID=UPI003C2AB840
MDPPFSAPGFVLDPSKCRKLSIEEKRELVHELSKWPESAPEKLQTWSRRDLLEILCAEMGKERKYTGLTKQRMIEYLFRVVSEKKSEHVEDTPDLLTANPQTPSKRPRKNEHPSRLPIVTNNLLGTDARHCQNLACRATLNLSDSFCKRCSCCICHKYDDNKDPSLWLFCSSDAPSQSDSCGLSCHLECALKHEKAGIVKNGQTMRLDGSYYCIYCGKENDLLGCWKKQLMVAKDARRVDVLSYRISLSHKLLRLTEKYQSLHDIVDTAVKKLEAEVGPITGIPNMARGIVNRLSVGTEVQKLCARALESLESMLSSASSTVQKPSLTKSSFIKFEDVLPTSVTLVLGSEDCATISQDLAGFNLWHRKTDIAEYSLQPTYTLINSERRFIVRELAPATNYLFKVVAFSNIKELGTWEVGVTTEAFLKDDSMGLAPGETRNCGSPKANSNGLSNPSSDGDESNNNRTAYTDLNKSPESYFECCENPEIPESEKTSDHLCKDKNNSQNANIGSTSETECTEQEETPGLSGSSLDEEPNSMIHSGSQRDSTNSMEHNQALDIPRSEGVSNARTGDEMVIECPDSTQQIALCGPENGKEDSGRSSKLKPGSNVHENSPTKPGREPGSSSKKRFLGKCEEICNKDGSLEGDYEYCVKMIRWLECEGHIETNFRVKFLTWFSLRATPQERRVVSVYVDTLIDDPASLAGQLVDTFSEAICSKRPPPVPTGFCGKLWH